MTEKLFKIVGLGEILWDLLPDGKRLGGAPTNFAYVANALGNDGIILSRVGDDEPGREILEELRAKNLSTEHIQIDANRQTGAVSVSFKDGQPNYKIHEKSAWDYMELSDDWREIALDADAICFGSLAQRTRASRHTIREVVNLTKRLRIFDVNLRQHFFTSNIVRKSLYVANVVKLNQEELRVVAEMFGIKKLNPVKAAKDLISIFGLKLVCITRGADGSLLIRKNEFSEHAGLKIEVADTVGAGDAFTAALAHGLLRGWSLDKINEFTNRVGAFVASQTGAMPVFPEDFLP
jgi:fructokinase